MTDYAIISMGDDSPRFLQLVSNLQAHDVNVNYLLEDIVSTVQYKDTFNVELLCLSVEIEYGDYYWHKLQEEPVLVTRDILSELAKLSKNIAVDLLHTIQQQGIYDDSGHFPYEFKSFNGGALLLQRRDLPRGTIRYEPPIRIT